MLREQKYKCQFLVTTLKFWTTLCNCFNAYSISNAVVKSIPIEHRLVINEYQWTISACTCIEEISDDQLTICNFALDVVQSNDLQHYDQPPQDINGLFAVLLVAPNRKIKVKSPCDSTLTESSLQEAVIIGENVKPIILTLWDQFGPNEGTAISNMPGQFLIVIGMRLKATSYNGLALATKSGSTFILNPPLPEAEALLNWCKFDLQLRDSSADITATIFGAQVEKLFSINAQKWMESTSTLSVETLATLYTPDEQIIQLHAYQFSTATTTRCKFNVNSVHRQCLPTTDHSTSETMLAPPPKKARKKLFEKESPSTSAEGSPKVLDCIT